jgi:hypothetical protein
LHNTIRWITQDEAVVHVDGDGFLELFAWETTPGYAIHLLNYTNPNAHHGWLSTVNPLGPQTVSMTLPSGVKVNAVDLLRSDRQHPSGSKARSCVSPYLVWTTMKSPW